MITKYQTTPLLKLSGSEFAHIKAFLKDESQNVTGTVKDRRSQFVLQEALRLGVDKLALITAGSNGYSLGVLADKSIEVVAIIDRTLPQEIKDLLASSTYQLLEVNLQHKILRPEEVIAFTREREDEVIWDVTNGYEEGYASIIAELREVNPNWIVVPIGSGGLYVGIIEAINRYRLTTQVVGIGVQNTIRSYADKLFTPWTPYFKVMNKLSTKGHPIYRLTENEIKAAWQKYQHIANLEPSSAIVFAALHKHSFRRNDIVVFINSGQLKLTKE